MDLQLDGKVALATGSSKGIGESVAEGLSKEGAVVIALGRDKIKTEEMAHDITILASPRAGYITGANLRLDGGKWPGLQPPVPLTRKVQQ
ncbi:SDR family NAD(P)-dependent oxidoreductase [Brucella cytisi]|uniref:SDR family NAD(P)-dependent oxidoreductase n=1 Tax=Brucella cytisi TaxID=407152 RepID=UPI0035D6A1F4